MLDKRPSTNNKHMSKEKIIKYYEELYKDEVKDSGQKIPQTMRGKKIRYLLKLIEEV